MREQKGYNPQEFEENIYKMWEENNCFYADTKSKKPAFCKEFFIFFLLVIKIALTVLFRSLVISTFGF